MIAVLAVVALITDLALLVRIMLVAARIYQIEEYEGVRLWRWSTQRSWNWHRSVIAGAVAALAGGAVVIGRGQATLAWWEMFGGSLTGLLLWRWTPPKKELVWTPRMRRIFATATVVIVILLGVVAAEVVRGAAVAAAFVVWLDVILMTTIPVCALVVANRLGAPVEARIRAGFVRRAAIRLAAVDPVVVAVAGSWGKTSTKHTIAALLPDSARAMPTPKSFNTLMGVTRTINDDLADGTGVFVVEMDAYGPREIADICTLVHPTIAVVTAVGAQHLERFGTVDRIATAMLEAVEALPADGTAVIFTGDENGAALAERARATGRRVITYADAAAGGTADVVAESVVLDADGSRFAWKWPELEMEHEIRVPLLGRHHVLNVSAALVVVQLLGHDVGDAVGRVATLTPVEHRLQRLPGANGVTVIDDSYNANPVGVHNGLEVLAAMGEGQKILVTPGLVELGPEEAAENRRYGHHAAEVCDVVIVMRARPGADLVAGLRDGGMDDGAVHVVDSLDEATAVIGRIARSGDVVLFANDLPDTYL